MKQPKKPFLVILAMMMVLTFTGCTSGNGNNASQESKEDKEKAVAEQKQPSDKPTVVRFSGLSAETFNPHTSDSAETSVLLQYINGNLLDIIYDETSDNVKFVSNHAADLPATTDNKVWTFKLKEGLKWTDGTPITARDYEYSYQMLLDPKLANRNAFVLFDNIPIVSANKYFKGEAKWEEVGIKAKDDLTLEIVLETEMPEVDVYSVFAQSGSTSTSPIHKQLYEAGMKPDRSETTYGTTLEQVPSSGTYRLTEWVRDQYRVFEKNPDAPMAAVYTPDRIESRVVSESSTRMQLWEKGEIENVSISGEQFDKYGEDPRVVYTEAEGVWGFYVNTESKKNPILANNDLRKALYYGIDRDKLSKGIFKTFKSAPYYISTICIVGDYKDGQRYRETEAAKANIPPGTGYEPEKAKEYFEKAYQANGNKKITIELTYFDAQETMKRTAEVTEELYENLFGKDKLDIKLRAMPPSAAYDSYRDGNFELGIGSITQNPFNPWSSMKAWRTDFPNRSHRFSSAEFDELQKRTATGDLLLKPEERLDALVKMEKMLLDFVPQIPLFQNNNAVLYQDRMDLKAKGKYFPVVKFAPLQVNILE
ncbi:peptide ABC transporter substrate-binding protein [Paenibacillus apiarius]|uniref:Peptide ABC transporter substrate-binding protein n=1 Tax=Paenibacillus apiarius TaxID=46240 RepID=A0ABT4E0A5_9BACL|nr:peptide ABC transporter substrate-binding protein [Paenibacillus apiarius]MCY9515109.1 peptide ABC transporter substrate-binding protein [Paenibacillus apiarius]MCY9522905.1 peptide ABC transporter substrate-binding protein [Paenibacillus apiarius]MCY9553708.1 peptide ABC transporter substrate-binding protein [Paenibacillus apiarius]MCY9556459.1 peptide ABC transporter substrate-binding protein [Paenibacillus apiarius]MCY9684893.1 peptide ABC transporter substrate-binding protein [Paenibaci